MTLRVQRRQCATCIFRPNLGWHLNALLNEIRDPHMTGFFAGYRICHHSKDAVCAGFWARHRDDFTLGQLAQRFSLVEFVEDESIRHQQGPYLGTITNGICTINARDQMERSSNDDQ